MPPAKNPSPPRQPRRNSWPMSQITLDRGILEAVLERAESAARLVSYIDDRGKDAFAVHPLADEIDAIVHELTELLGNPHLIAASVSDACSTFGADDVTRADLVTKRWDEPTPAPVPPNLAAAFTADEPTRLHVRRLRPMHRPQRQYVGNGSTWPADPREVPAVEPSRLATGWIRGATVAALIALLGVISILLTLGACIATGGMARRTHNIQLALPAYLGR